MDVFHLFPPIDEVKAHSKAVSLRVEALDVSCRLLEDLLSSLPLERDRDDGNGPIRVDDRTTDSLSQGSGELTTVEDGEENAASPSEVSTAAVEGPSILTEWEREVDRDARLKILLKLLQLACLMVRAVHVRVPVCINLLCMCHIPLSVYVYMYTYILDMALCM